MQKRAKVAWAVGLIGAIGYFFYFEIPAISNTEDGDSFSEFVWWLLSVPVLKYIVGLVLVFLALWLPVHLLGKGKYDKRVSAFLKRIFTRGES